MGKLETGWRLFAGGIKHSEEVPDSVFLSPQDLDLARLRIASEGLEKVRRINTAGLDLLYPAWMPLPDWTFAINRQAKWRVFADIGVSEGPNHIYRDVGFGYYVPIGGDLVGKGSFSVLKFSMLVVAYSDIDGKKEGSPGFLVDFTGQL